MAFYLLQLHQIKLKDQKVVHSDIYNIIINAARYLPTYLWKDADVSKFDAILLSHELRIWS
jgi:hypothetical protein